MVKCTMMHRENAPRTARRGSARRPGLRDRPAPFQSRVVSEPRPQEALPGPFAHAGASLPRSSSRSVHHYSDSCLRECENRPAVNCARRSESVLHQSDSCLWECGNRPTISKGGGKSRKSRFGISTLSTDRHFHRLRRRATRQNTAKTPCTSKHGEFSISPLDHHTYTVKHVSRTKMRAPMRVTPIIATDPP